MPAVFMAAWVAPQLACRETTAVVWKFLSVLIIFLKPSLNLASDAPCGLLVTPNGQRFRILLMRANSGNRVCVASAWDTLRNSLQTLHLVADGALWFQIFWSCWTCWIACAPDSLTWFSLFSFPRRGHKYGDTACQ